MKNAIKFLVAVLLVPTTLFAVAEVCAQSGIIIKNFQNGVGFLAGAALYCVIHFSCYQFERMYVFGHETTHAVAAMFFGFRIHSISVKKDSGHVKMDRCNAAVVLAPYFVPFYAVIAGLIYLAVHLVIDASAYRPVFMAAVGFFMAFHWVQTFKTLWETQQPDLKMAGGVFFSWVIILLCNAAVFSLVLKCLFPQEIFLLEMARGVVNSTYNLWKIVINYIIDQIIAARR